MPTSMPLPPQTFASLCNLPDVAALPLRAYVRAGVSHSSLTSFYPDPGLTLAFSPSPPPYRLRC